MTDDEAEKRLVDSGIPNPDVLLSMLAPSVRLEAEPSDEESLALGASRFGGVPDVPAGFEWPRFDGRPLGFLALLNLSEFAASSTNVALPSEGYLLFFYDNDDGRWGFDPADAGCARVLYLPAQPLVRTQPPADISDANVFRACALSFTPACEMPDLEGHVNAFPFDLRDDAVWSAFNTLRDDFESAGPNHHIGGHPQPIQGDMKLECQLVSHGLFCGDSTGYDDPRSAKLGAGAQDWVLLLQIDTDEDGPQWVWGDSGILYFWIRRQDARSRDFSRAWMILQCG